MPRSTLLLIILPLFAAGCGGGDPDSPESGLAADDFANRIEEISVLQADKEAAVPSRVGAVAETEIPPEYLAGPSCRFHANGRLVLLGAAPGAIAHIDGRPARLRVTGPVGPSGGFFEAPGITFSVGRRPPPESATTAEKNGTATKAPAPAPAAAPGSNAGATIGGDREKPIERITGTWACRA